MQTCQCCGKPTVNGWFDDAGKSVVKRNGQRVAVQPVRWKILSCLRSKHGQPISQSNLYDMVYGDRLDPPHDNTVRVHIHYLRRALKGTPVKIRKRKGVGYILEIAA